MLPPKRDRGRAVHCDSVPLASERSSTARLQFSALCPILLTSCGMSLLPCASSSFSSSSSILRGDFCSRTRTKDEHEINWSVCGRGPRYIDRGVIDSQSYA